VQHKFISYAVRRLPWRVWPLPAYDAKCLLIGLAVLSNRRIVASALFARDIVVGRVDCEGLAIMLRFQEVSYSRRRNAELLTFFHRTNYVRFETVNNAIINFKYCHWFGFCGEMGIDMFRDILKFFLTHSWLTLRKRNTFINE
jgi:hypothetical protein